MRNLCALLVLLALPLAAEKKVISPPEFAGGTTNFSPGILVDGTLYVSGQVGQDLKTKQSPADFETEVKTLQAMKTGALLRFGCVAGAILGQAGAAKYAALDRYGSVLGEAFQIADDLLDLEGDPALVGKATGKDAAAHKATQVGVLGVAAAKRRLEALVAEAQTALAPFGTDADVLKAAARFVATRSA